MSKEFMESGLDQVKIDSRIHRVIVLEDIKWYRDFCNEQIDGITEALANGKIFKSVEDLERRQEGFKKILKLINTYFM